MFVLSREIGQSILIEDVEITLVDVRPEFAEVTFQKDSGGQKRSKKLPHDESVAICYDAQMVFIQFRNASSARIGIEAPTSVQVFRKETGPPP